MTLNLRDYIVELFRYWATQNCTAAGFETVGNHLFLQVMNEEPFERAMIGNEFETLYMKIVKTRDWKWKSTREWNDNVFLKTNGFLENIGSDPWLKGSNLSLAFDDEILRIKGETFRGLMEHGAMLDRYKNRYTDDVVKDRLLVHVFYTIWQL